ncbi:MAG TPA: prolyl oligopeptidase family serine peptidase [Longimicrobiales bacterium]
MPAFRTLAAVLVVLLASSSAAGQTAAKKALDHSDYDLWYRITGPALAADGSAALYGLASEASDPVLVVQRLAAGAAEPVRIERGEGGTFSHDGRFVVFRLKPSKAAVEEARKKRTRAADMPRDSFGILDLRTGAVVRIADLRDFGLPEKAGGWVAYRLQRVAGQDSARAERDSTRAREAAAQPAEEKGESEQPRRRERRKQEGSTLVVRNLDTGEERRIEFVDLYRFSRDGKRLAYTVSTRDGEGDGAFVLDLATGRTITLLAGKGEYRGLVFDRAGRQVAFLSNRDDYEAEQPAYTLYAWEEGRDSARVVAAVGTRGIPEGWWISEHATLSFSESGRRLLFGTAPRPAPEPEDSTPEDEKVILDVWHWQDPYIQPMQLRQVDRERRRSYQAVAHLREGRIVQLATREVPGVTVARNGDGRIALGQSDLPYRQAVSWDRASNDIYLVDVETGQRTKVLEGVRSNVSISPEGKYLTWFDGHARAWFAMDVESRRIVNISSGIPHPVHDELDDTPDEPRAYGSAGWMRGDERFLIYDRHDIWLVDPTGRAAPRNITEGLGRREDLRLRYVALDPEARAIEPEGDLLLEAFHYRTKASGFYRDRVAGSAPPRRLIMEDRSFGRPRRAEKAPVLMLTRESFREFPDLYVTDPDFSALRRISDANPQQAQYRWGTAELVEWRSADGTPLQGVLYKPEDFDPTRKYPLLVYFYERLSQNLHNYVAPAAGSSSINISFYVSRGYLVFTPDIPYRIGYPGESALGAVVPGVLSLIEQGFVDPERIGVQGHSWGGYQIAFMVTRTNLFAAAVAGAPVANMVSAYGGIRWSTGMSRMFQYEQTQSRIGGTLWQRPLQFIENSPIFWADKVETPLLMMHNDQDGAVPWYQGIEYFLALRRLGKPVWLINYNGEDHGLSKAQNRKDWAIRMQQFFDHFLMDAPAPVWLAQGIPATEKGRTLGLELLTEAEEPARVAETPEAQGR